MKNNLKNVSVVGVAIPGVKRFYAVVKEIKNEHVFISPLELSGKTLTEVISLCQRKLARPKIDIDELLKDSRVWDTERLKGLPL